MDYSTLNNGKIKVALAQTRIVWEEQDRNYEEAARRVGEAAGQKAEAVFFPELHRLFHEYRYYDGQR